MLKVMYWHFIVEHALELGVSYQTVRTIYGLQLILSLVRLKLECDL